MFHVINYSIKNKTIITNTNDHKNYNKFENELTLKLILYKS